MHGQLTFFKSLAKIMPSNTVNSMRAIPVFFQQARQVVNQRLSFPLSTHCQESLHSKVSWSRSYAILSRGRPARSFQQGMVSTEISMTRIQEWNSPHLTKHEQQLRKHSLVTATRYYNKGRGLLMSSTRPELLAKMNEISFGLPLIFNDNVMCLSSCAKNVRFYSTVSRKPFSYKGNRASLTQHGVKRGLTGKDRTESTTAEDEAVSSTPGDDHSRKEASDTEVATKDKKPLTLYQRFKKTYKEHGKVLVAVHLFTSSIWFGSFYTAAKLGVDIVPLLESWNFSEKIISPFRSGGLGNIALAYLMYKLATPARYTVTIGGTNLVIKYLRKEGKMSPISAEDTLRSMYKEGKADLKKKRDARVRRIQVRLQGSKLGRLRQRQKGGQKR